VTTVTVETISPDGLIPVQVMVARIACRWMTAAQLEAVSASIDRAARLPARSGMEHHLRGLRSMCRLAAA
jgi:hypothetical protein